MQFSMYMLYTTCLSSVVQVGIAHSSGFRPSLTFSWDSAHSRNLLLSSFDGQNLQHLQVIQGL